MSNVILVTTIFGVVIAIATLLVLRGLRGEW